MQKLFNKAGVCFVTLMLFTFFSCQPASAEILPAIKPIADVFATNSNEFYGNTDYLTVANSNIGIQSNAYLKFNVTDFLSSSIDEFTLKLYGHPEFISNYTGNVHAFYATDQVYWDNNTPFTWDQRPILGAEIPAGIIPIPNTNIDQLFTWELTKAAIAANESGGLLTLALQLSGPVGAGYQIAATDFIASNNECCPLGPELVPIPEPSSVMLSLIGLCKILLFRNKYNGGTFA